MNREHQPLFNVLRQLPDRPLTEQRDFLVQRRNKYLQIQDNLTSHKPTDLDRSARLKRTQEIIDLSLLSLQLAISDTTAAISSAYDKESIPYMLKIRGAEVSQRRALIFPSDFTREQEEAYERVKQLEPIKPPAIPDTIPVTPSEPIPGQLITEEIQDRPILGIEFDDTRKIWGLIIDGEEIEKIGTDEYNLLLELAWRERTPLTRKSVWKNAIRRGKIQEDVLNTIISNVNQILKNKAGVPIDYIVPDPDDLSRIKILDVTSTITSRSVTATKLGYESGQVEAAAPLPSKPEVGGAEKEDKPSPIIIEFGRDLAVMINGTEFVLNHFEHRLLTYLVENPDTTFRRKGLSEAVFGKIDPELHYYILAINATLLQATNIRNAVKISREGVAYTYTLTAAINPVTKPDEYRPEAGETQTIPETLRTEPITEQENIHLPLTNDEEAILGATILGYNGQVFPISDEAYTTINFDTKILDASRQITGQFSMHHANYFYGKQKKYAAVRNSLLKKVARFFESGSNPGQILAAQSELTRTILDYIYQMDPEVVKGFVNYLSSLNPKQAWESNRMFINGHESQIRGEDKIKGQPEVIKDITEERDKLGVVKALAPSITEPFSPIGIITLESYRGITGHLRWDDLEIAGFIVRQLPNSDLRNTRLLTQIWQMIRFIQQNPEDSRTKRPRGSRSVRSLNPKMVPNLDITSQEAANIRLLFQTYRIEGQTVITLEKIFRNHEQYISYLNRKRL